MTTPVAPVSPEFNGYGEIVSYHESAMSRVFLTDGQSPVVIKTLNDDPTEFARASLQAEPKILGELEHSQVPTLIDDRTDEQRPYFVMSREPSDVDYKDFYDEPDPEFAAEIILSGLRPLGYMHGKRFIHRDVKPAHFAVLSSARATLLDFGLALPEPYNGRIERGEIAEGSEEHLRARDHHLKFAPSLLSRKSAGTPDYMAPEQVRGFDADVRSDIFAMGISLYELVYGRRPFSSGRPKTKFFDYRERVEDELVGAVPAAVENGNSDNGEPPDTPPHTIAGRRLYKSINFDSHDGHNVPAALISIIDRATQKDPDHRYQLAEEMQEEIERYLRDQGSLAAA